MQRLGPKEVGDVGRRLRLDFDSAREDSNSRKGGTVLQVWKEGQRRTHRQRLVELLEKRDEGMGPKELFGEMKNMAVRWGSNILCAGKVVYPERAAQETSKHTPKPCKRRRRRRKTQALLRREASGDDETQVGVNIKQPMTKRAMMVGAGGVFVSAKGTNLKETGQAAMSKWAETITERIIEAGVKCVIEDGEMWLVGSSPEEADRKLRNRMSFDPLVRRKVYEKGTSVILAAWWKDDTVAGARWWPYMRHREGLDMSEEVDASVLPDEGLRVFQELFDANSEEATKFETASWEVWRRLYFRKNANKNKDFKERERLMEEMVHSLEKGCSLESGLVAEVIWKGGEDAWEANGQEIMQRLRKGLCRLPVAGFDGEGEGCYYQLAWLGELGLEALVLGPGFFPQEVMEVLEDEDVYVLGVNVWEDLLHVLGKKKGWKGVDLSILTSDMPSAKHSKPGMATLIYQATGVKVDHLKKPWEQKFVGLRSTGWKTIRISDEKIVYAAMDATMALVIFYDVLLHWMSRYKQADFLEGDSVTWKAFLSRILGPLVDRRRVDGRENSDSFVRRDLLTHSAGIYRSSPIEEDREMYTNINWEGDPVARRNIMRMEVAERYRQAREGAMINARRQRMQNGDWRGFLDN
jgi:hypothetical protein